MNDPSSSDRRTEREHARLAALDRYDILDTPRERAFDDIAALAAEICETPIAVVNLIGDGRQWFKAEIGLGVRETPLETSFCGHAILEDDFLLVPDTREDARFTGNPLVTGEPGLRFYAGALLKTSEGLPIGTLCVLDHRPRTLNERQIATLRRLARQVMTQLELRRSLLQEQLVKERLEAVLGSATDYAIFTMDPAGTIMTWSAGAEAIFGWRVDEAVGASAAIIFTPEDRAAGADRRELETAAREGCAIDERWHVRKDGGRVFMNGSVQPLPPGQRPGFLKIARDETARRSADEARIESETRLQAIANSIDQMVWSTRSDGYHDFFNERWYDYTGMTPGSTDGEAWNGMFHPDDQARAWETWRRSLATGEPYRIEYRLRHRSGDYRWVLGRAQAVRDEQGAVTRWYGTCTEIQEIVEAREVLARSREQLERAVAERTAERDSAWRNAQDLLVVLDTDGILRAANPAWYPILGLRPEEVVGRRYLDLIHPDDHAASRGALAHATHEVLRGFETRLRHRDGSYRLVAWVASPEGERIYATGRDLTEERARAEALQLAQDALRHAQKMEAVGQLTGGVAHDFNNLLTIIRSSADLLRRPDLAEDRRRRYVDAIADTVDRAARLTGQLLAFARRQALKPEVFDASERVRAVSDMLRTIVGSRIRITIDAADTACLVEADASQFETALVNMTVNARDAMDGEGALMVRVGAVSAMPPIRGHGGTEGRFVAVSLADSGAGIPPERLAQIFEPFFTTKEVGKGTGLGLSQVYGFAKQSGGDIDVCSGIGHGTTFTLYLPHADRPLAVASDEARPAASPEHGRGRRVLVVEDNVEVGRFSTQILEDLGYETIWAANADDALTRLDEGDPFDVVFSDVVMPGISGVELGLEIRRRRPGLPVVLTSGYSHVLAQEGRHGFELLQKPYAAEELSRVLRRATGRAED